MHTYSVYIVQCSDGSYYTGVTNDVERRINEHNKGIDTHCYTYKKRPVTLVFSHQFSQVESAIEAEKQIKGWSRAKKEALINGNTESLPSLSKKDFGKRLDR